MSYILDALRKSAEDRRKLQAQKPVSFDPLSITRDSQSGARTSRYAFLSVSLLLVGAVTGIWLYYVSLKPDQSPPESATITSSRRPAGDTARQSSFARQIIPPPADRKAAEPTVPPASMVETSPPKQPSPQPADPRPDPVATAEKPSTPAAAGIPLLKELPFATQAAIPEMKFSGHVFSADPGLRLIMVNTSIVREGDIIAPDLRLVEITENGLVISFRQKRFRVELF